MKAKLGAAVSQVTILRGVIAITGMPIQTDIDTLEQPSPNHVDLAAATFFRRRAVDPDLSFGAGRLQPVFNRDRRGHRTGAEQMMATGVTRMQIGDRLTFGHRGLRHARQGVDLGEERDHRSIVAASAGDERRGQRRRRS